MSQPKPSRRYYESYTDQPWAKEFRKDADIIADFLRKEAVGHNQCQPYFRRFSKCGKRVGTYVKFLGAVNLAAKINRKFGQSMNVTAIYQQGAYYRLSSLHVHFHNYEREIRLMNKIEAAIEDGRYHIGACPKCQGNIIGWYCEDCNEHVEID